jgi:hypothetical protein
MFIAGLSGGYLGLITGGFQGMQIDVAEPDMAAILELGKHP